MRRTFRYSISLSACLILLLPAMAQEGRVRGPRIGYNANSLALFLIEPSRQIHTFSVDYEFKQDVYPVLEFGWQKVDLSKDAFHYMSNGMFAKLGVDLNRFKYDNPVDYDMGFAGLRYGISRFTHSASDIDIEEPYWGNLENAEVPEKQMYAHWVSVGGGLRAEVFHNVFMGWSVFANLRLAQTKDSHMKPYNIPGFGDGSKRLNIIINYTLYYRISTANFE